MLNPRTAPYWLAAALFSGGAIAITLSAGRLQTVAAESQANNIAQYRAGVCRILHSSESVELGAYYYQPTAGNPDVSTGSLLVEGVYICDQYGRSARIERGGYAQFLTTASDLGSVNQQLQQRLADPNNPDSSPASQVRRAWNLGIHQARPTNQFFNLQPQTNQGGEG